MGGLLAARTLSESYDRVIVVDRDSLAGTGHRKGVPQSQHAHAILAKGREVLEDLFPGLTAELTDAGALTFDLHNDVIWFNGHGPLSRAPSDLLGLSLSRPALEDYIRRRVRELPNVDLWGEHEAVDLITTADGSVVTGVTVVALADARQDIMADLVVDATGRGNRSTTWLGRLGYDLPAEDSVKAGIVYATREYVRRPLPSGSAAVITLLSPACPYSAVLLPMEGDRWILTLVGIGDDIPPTDVEGFNEFARRLPISDLHDIIDHAQPLTEPKRFRAPASVRRRYDRLRRRPDGYLVIADALCAFNPVYGQGMTVAAVEALVLRDCLRESTDDLPRRFYAKTAPVIDIPWDMAVGGDLAFPAVEGNRTTKIRILNAYIAKVLHAAETDPEVGLAFHRTVNLTNRPERLLMPRTLARVLFARRADASVLPPAYRSANSDPQWTGSSTRARTG
jgi:2-polyprenyl-6-methoxyphenol hydroxylase-like FAD-dependent oxidoreductase